uniref:Uncharacterized protein n=1 Tax=Arundo donax TaxID=35708 RepID=A0A0A9HL64_ARUDO
MWSLSIMMLDFRVVSLQNMLWRQFPGFYVFRLSYITIRQHKDFMQPGNRPLWFDNLFILSGLCSWSFRR